MSAHTEIQIMIDEEANLCEACQERNADVIVTLCSPLRTPVRACARCALQGVADGACEW